MPFLLRVLQFSHIVVPWIIFARRLRKERALPPKPAAVVVEESEAPRRKRDKNKRKKEMRATAEAAAAKAASAAAPHHTHRCDGCGAPVPLAEAPFPCPHCAVKVVPPPDSVAAYRNMVAANRLLALAERTWKRAVLWGSPIWVLLFWLGITVWSAGYLYLLIATTLDPTAPQSTKLDRVLLFLSAPSGIFGWCLWMVMVNDLGKLGRVFGKVPRAFFQSLPPQDAACSHCGAAVTFESGRLATVCTYCAAEEIRPSLAKRAAEEARSMQAAAHASIIEAYRAIVERREALLRYVDGMALGAVVLVAIDILSWIPIVGRVFEIFQ